MCDHSKAPAHMRSIEIDLPPNTNAQALIHIAYMGQILLKQALQPVVSMHNTVMYTLLPTLATSAWLSLSVLATAMSIHAETSRPSKYVPSPQVMQTCVILVSLLSIAANVTMFILTQVHCMLTVAAACSFLAQPHWITACVIMIYAPKAINQLTVRLAHVIQYAIQSLVKNPKQSKFPHPSIQNGTYWRRIRNKTRRLHKQPVYRYIKVLCWLHHFIQQSTPQQPNCSKQHASQPEKERPTHMQGEAKCEKTGDKNAATQHKPDHHRDTHSQKRRAAHAHHRRSANAVIYTRNKTKQKKHTSTT